MDTDTTFDEHIKANVGEYIGDDTALLETIGRGAIWYHRSTGRVMVSDAVTQWSLPLARFETLRDRGAIVKDRHGLDAFTDIWTAAEGVSVNYLDVKPGKSCDEYFPGDDAGGAACTRCGVLPAEHKDPQCPKGWKGGKGGGCANCGRAAGAHPAAVAIAVGACAHLRAEGKRA